MKLLREVSSQRMKFANKNDAAAMEGDVPIEVMVQELAFKMRPHT